MYDAAVEAFEDCDAAIMCAAVPDYTPAVCCDKKMKPKDTRTQAQRDALKAYVLDFHRRHPKVRIVGHCDLAAKACPSFNVAAWLKEIGIKQ